MKDIMAKKTTTPDPEPIEEKDPNAFDFDVLTAGESAYIEKLSGVSLAKLGDQDDPPPMAQLAAACYVVYMRRWKREQVTINVALQKPLPELMETLGWTDKDEKTTTPDPDPASADPDADALLGPIETDPTDSPDLPKLPTASPGEPS